MDRRKKLITSSHSSDAAAATATDEGACGGWHGNNELVAAISAKRWNGGRYCGKRINVCRGRRCVAVKVVDECMGCGASDIDLSPKAFSRLATLDTGVVPIKWQLS